MSERSAWAVFWLSLGLVAGAVAFWSSGDDPVGRLGDEPLVTLAAVAVACAAAGTVVRPRQPRIAGLLLVSGCGTALSLIGFEYARVAMLDRHAALPLGRFAAMIGWAMWAPGFGIMAGVVPQLFPDGHLLSRRWRYAVGLAGISIALGITGSLLTAATAETVDLFSSETPSGRAGQLVVIADVGRSLMLVTGLLGVVSLVLRYRRSTTAVRRQLLWLVIGLVAMVSLLTLAVVIEPAWVVFDAAGAMALPAAMAIAIRRHRLWDVERVVSRGAIYLAMSALVGAAYVVVVAAGATVFEARSSAGVAVVAVVAVAVAFQPARDVIQARVDRMVYGSRRDATATFAALRHDVRARGGRADVLESVVGSLRDELRLGYVAVALDGAESEPAAAAGDPRPGIEVPLLVDGEQVGALLAAAAPGDRLTAADRAVLEAIASQVALLVLTSGLVEELHVSRGLLVVAREDERRRLRRDLHDGLGPALAGLAMQASAASAMAATDPARTAALLARISEEANEITRDVRRLVHGLRPPALDELGLAKAVEQFTEAASTDRSGAPVLSFSTDGDLSALPAAVEVAAYRIATEAVTNVRKHASATRCEVRFCARESLVIEVIDDGRGIETDARSGVGLLSMRERVTELSGSLEIESDDAGTRVVARIPLT